MKMVCKKLLSLVLVALMLVSAVPFQASADTGYNVTLQVRVGGWDTPATDSNTLVKSGTITLNAALLAEFLPAYNACSYEVVSWTVDGQGKANGETAEIAGDTTLVVLVNQRDGHNWVTKVTTEATCGTDGVQVEECSVCGATRNETVIPATGAHKYGGWIVTKEPSITEDGSRYQECEVCHYKNVQPISKKESKTIKFVDTFNGAFDEITRTYEIGTLMDLPSAPDHTDEGYEFLGWYTQQSGGSLLKDKTECTSDMESTYFARYSKISLVNNSIYLHIYDGSTQIKEVKLDTWSCVKDGVINLSELKEVVKTYYTAKTSDGIGYSKIFMTNDDRRDQVNGVEVVDNVNELKKNGPVHLYLNISNYQTKSSSSSSSSSSNPKTGDTIYMAVTVMGLSAASLAAVYYISKKRAVR